MTKFELGCDKRCRPPPTDKADGKAGRAKDQDEAEKKS